MAEDILDSLRRVVSRWVDTQTPIVADVLPGDHALQVESTVRFEAGEEVMIEGPTEGEPSLVIDEIIDETNLTLTTPVQNEWLSDDNIVLRKLINGQFVDGIYIGDPDVIPKYPAVTITAQNITSDWMTLDSTREYYDVEVALYVQSDTHENGYRFMLRMANEIREGLKRNIYLLVNDFDTTSIKANVQGGDKYIYVDDSSIFETPLTDRNSSYPRLSDARAIIENRWESEETRVQRIISDNVIEIDPIACRDYDTDNNPIVIRPKRFIYNSWPYSIDYGKVAKESLLQAAVIKWFAEEEKIVDFKNNDPHLK